VHTARTHIVLASTLPRIPVRSINAGRLIERASQAVDKIEAVLGENLAPPFFLPPGSGSDISLSLASEGSPDAVL
jgi:hypothetical protein